MIRTVKNLGRAGMLGMVWFDFSCLFFLGFSNLFAMGRILQGQCCYHWNCTLAIICHGAEHTHSNIALYQVFTLSV